MANLSIFFCGVFTIFGLFFEKKWLNPITIFFGEWTIIIFLSNLNLFNLNHASNEIYFLILLGCIFYAIGYYLVKYINLKHLDNTIKYVNNYKINKKMVYTLVVITFLFFAIDFSKSVIFLAEGYGLNYLRERAQSGDLQSSPLLNAIRILVVAPFSLALAPIAASNFFSKKKDRFLLIMTIFIIFFRLFSDGGRSPFIYLIFSFLICFFFSNIKRKKNRYFSITKIKKRNIYLGLFIVMCSLILYYVTLSRSGDDSLRFTYYYFAMEPYMFERWSNIVDFSNLTAFGMASLNGFLFPLFYLIVNIMGFSAYPDFWRNIYNMIESVGTEWQVITSKGLTANSYKSIFWTFYFDGRVFGIIIGMLLYGMIVSFYFKKVLSDYNQKNLSLYCLILIGVFYTFQQLVFENIYYSVAFIILSFFVYKKERLNESISCDS